MADGTLFLAGAYAARLWYYNGSSWAEQRPAGDAAKNWNCSAINKDGTIKVAGVYGGRLYLYSGGAWAETRPAGDANKNWRCCAVSESGSVIIAGNSLRLYVSTNSGANWSEAQPGGNVDLNWHGCDVNTDGTVLLASAYNSRLYKYSSSSWAEIRPNGDTNKWYFTKSTKLSGDGTKIIAGTYQSGFYTYNGSSWTAHTIAGSTTPSASETAISGDGTKFMTGQQSTSDGIYYYVSSWVDKAPSLGMWSVCGMSYDGTKLIAGKGGNSSYKGRLYTSANSGTNWTEQQPAGAADMDWRCVSINREGVTKVTYDKTVTAKSRIKLANITKTCTSKVRIKQISTTKTSTSKIRILSSGKIQTVTTKVNILNTVTQTISAKTRIKYSGTQTVTAKVNILRVPISIVELYRPEPGTDGVSPTTFEWFLAITDSDKKIHSEIQIDDTSNAFESIEHTQQSWKNNTNMEYWNGEEWLEYPLAGVPKIYEGNAARLTVELSLGIKYWRVRGGVNE